MSKDNVTRRISIFVNGKEVENSLKGVEGAMAQVRNRMRLLNSDSENYDKDSKELAKTMNDLRQKQSDYRDELGLTNKTMQETNEISGGLRGTLSGIWDSLVSGDMQGAKEGLTSIKEGMGGLVKSSIAFVATPLGAAIAALVGFAAGAKAMFDFNVNAEKSAQLIENLSGKTGQVVEDIRIKMQALSDTFEVGFESLAGAVDNLVDTGVAKDEFEALEKIKNGLLTAPDKNEFISSLESSAVTAKQVGFDLEEVIALKKSIEETGVNPEATFGALEKAGKNLAQQTDKLRGSLTSAFGAAFTDDILAKVKTGQITTVQALDLINTKSKEVGLNQTQQAQIGAELFGKAAQSAGGYATILETVSGGLKKQNQELNGNQKALKELADANEKLGDAQSKLFRVQNFGELWTKIKTAAIDALAGIITYVTNLKNDIQPLLDIVGGALVIAWHLFKEAVVIAFDVVGAVVKGFFDYFKFGFNLLKAILTGDFKGAIQLVGTYFSSLGTTVEKLFGKIKNSVIDAVSGIVKTIAPLLDAIGLDVDFIQKKLEGFKSKEIDLSVNDNSKPKPKPKDKELTEDEKKALQAELDAQKTIRDAARQKELDAQKAARDKKKQEEEKAAQEEKDRLLEFAKAKAAVAKAELDLYIANNRSKIENGKELTLELVNQEAERLREIEQKKLDAALVEREKQIADAQKKFEEDKINLETLNLLKYEADLEYETARTNLSLQTEEQILANKKALEEQEKALKAEQLILDYELEVAEADTKYQADLLRKQQAYDAEVKLLEAKKNKGIITEDEYKRFVIAAQREISDFKRQQTLSDLQTALGAMNNLAGALGEMFGQSKELAITQAVINGALSVTSILSAASMGNPIVDAVVKGVQIAAAVGTTIAQVSKIKSAKPPKKINLKADKGFFYGGNTGTTASLGYDKYGPVTGYVHKNEYVIPEVMTQDPRFANTIGWLEANRQQKLRGYVEGGPTSSGVSSSNGSSASPEQDYTMMLFSAVSNLNSILSAGIKANVFLGYDHIEKIEEMKTEINQSKQNGIAG